MPQLLLSALVLLACGEKGDDTGLVDDGETTQQEDDTSSTTAGDCAVVGGDLTSAFLSVWGTSWDDVYMVGGDVGQGPAMAHFDGADWSLLAPGGAGDLWWVTGPAEDLLLITGDAGRVLTYVPSTGAFTEHTLPDAADFTLFGGWGASADDLWVVGGNISVSPSNSGAGGIWHYDGKAWTAAALPPEADAQYVYKAWGSGADDVWFVGSGGLATHWDGAALSFVDTGITRNLFTVSGQGGDVYAVGGYGDGTLLNYSGGSWVDETPDYSPQLNGVYADSGGAVACGQLGAIYTNSGAGWEADACSGASTFALHACWLDSDGAVWSVGGSISSYPLDQGVIVYGGDREVPQLSF